MLPEHSSGSGGQQPQQQTIRCWDRRCVASCSQRQDQQSDQPRRGTDRRGMRQGSRSWGVVVGDIVPWGGGDPSEIPQHLVHLLCINGGVIPAHTVASGDQMASDLSVSHAANELFPGGLQTLAVGDTCLSSVVEEFIVPDPEGSVPGFVVCPTVHGVVCCVNCAYYKGSVCCFGGPGGRFSNRTPDQRWRWCWHRCDTSGSVHQREGTSRSCIPLPMPCPSGRRG